MKRVEAKSVSFRVPTGATEIAKLGQDKVAEVFRVVGMHEKFLDGVESSIIREKEGQEIVYVPDFHELYTYAYPYDDAVTNAIAIHFVVHYSKRPFMLLVGTVNELIEHLNYVAGTLPKFQSLGDVLATERDRDFLGTAQEHSELLSLSSPQEKDSFIPITTAQTCSRLVRVVREYTSGVDRLYDFFQTANFVNPLDIVERPDELYFDKKAYSDILSALDIIRPEGSRSSPSSRNENDARNIVGVIALHKYVRENKRPYFVSLLTHTMTLLNPETWVRDDVAERYGLPSQVFRTPYRALYNTIAEQHYPNLDARRNYVISALDICAKVKSILRCRSEFIPSSQEENMYVPELIVAMEKKRMKQYLDDLATYISDPIMGEIETYMDANHIFDRNKSLVRKGRPQDIVFSSLERIRKRISDLLSLCQTSLEWSQRDYKKVFSLRNFHLHSESSYQKDIQCQQHKIRDSRGVAVLEIDKYEDFYSVSWPAQVTLDEFCDLINSILVTSDLKWTKDDSESNVYNNGILIFDTERKYELDLKIPLAVEWLSNSIGEKPIRYIRINTGIGDFCYDVLPQNLERPRLFLSVISHIDLSDQILELLSRSSTSPIVTYVTQSLVGKELSTYEAYKQS